MTDDFVLNLIGRDQELFAEEVARYEERLGAEIRCSSFLVIGGAGTIGSAVVREIFLRRPRVLHVVDISENNLVELVRDLRSSVGYIEGDFQTFAIDCGSMEFDLFFSDQNAYDYVLNFSALKHVRSERDPYTLMRMIDVNILSVEKTLGLAQRAAARKYFCVSTDKAANPVNMMGASKRIMEICLLRWSSRLPVSAARFANVAFSDGSLLHGFNQRMARNQPIAAPRDVRRYFLTAREAGHLCVLACMLGENGDIFFPKLSARLHLITLSEIAERYVRYRGFEPTVCDSEEAARADASELIAKKRWPCHFFDSDTTGEKDVEEFYSDRERPDFDRFRTIGVIKGDARGGPEAIDLFLERVRELRARRRWDKRELIELFTEVLPEFRHMDTGKHLEQRM
jgi:UDP-N-acetylglucosamine 4,6-dehydratase